MIAICVNIAGLLLARSQERKQEIAVRVALGAARLQLFRQIALENLLLALPSAALGIGFAYGLAPSIVKLLPDPRGLVQYAATPQILAVQPDSACSAVRYWGFIRERSRLWNRTGLARNKTGFEYRFEE